MKRILDRLLFPALPLVLASVPAAAALLAYTFLYGAEDSPVAYVSYLLSAYSLVIVCARLARLPRGAVRAMLHRNPYIHRYLTDVPFKTHVSLYLSLGVNLLFVVIKMFYGLRCRSVWFGTLAVYYMLLAVMRFLLLRHVRRNAIGQDLVAELRHYRLCGVILMVMNIALLGVIVLVILDNESFQYTGYLIYVVAMYAFYNVISAARDVVRYRKYNSPVIAASTSIKLAAALVSILSLETAMLMEFNDPVKGEAFRRTMTGATGGAVCACILALAVFMVAKSTRQLHRLQAAKGTEGPYD